MSSAWWPKPSGSPCCIGANSFSSRFSVLAAKNVHGSFFLFKASGQCAADKAGAAEQQYIFATHDSRSSKLW